LLYALKAVPTKLDATDHKILDVLAHDARRSASEVGRLVGLSPPAAKRRIERMEDTGVIRGYTVRLDLQQLGEQIDAFIELPEVVASYTLAGDPDALAHVRVRDLEHLKGVVDRIRRGRRGGPKVLTTRTVIVLGRND
jgi:Lrp/AsnC family transcriptional regulator, leucine-responsive regulatory protein